MCTLRNNAVWMTLLASASLLLWPSAARAAQPKGGAADATISSDEVEVVNNGVQTIFTGHVVLTRKPYMLLADRMTRLKETGVVDAEGHVTGTWLQPSGEKLEASGSKAKYDPVAQTTELWEDAKLTRWETAKDTAPLVVTAQRFIAHIDQQVLLAEHQVHISRAHEFWAQSDEAKYEQRPQVLHLWGEHRTILNMDEARGSGNFLCDRALLFLSPRRVRLLDRVKGHVIPAP